MEVGSAGTGVFPRTWAGVKTGPTALASIGRDGAFFFVCAIEKNWPGFFAGMKAICTKVRSSVFFQKGAPSEILLVPA